MPDLSDTKFVWMSDRNKNVKIDTRLSKAEKDKFIQKVGKGEVAYIIRKMIIAYNKDLIDFKPDNK